MIRTWFVALALATCLLLFLTWQTLVGGFLVGSALFLRRYANISAAITLHVMGACLAMSSITRVEVGWTWAAVALAAVGLAVGVPARDSIQAGLRPLLGVVWAALLVGALAVPALLSEFRLLEHGTAPGIFVNGLLIVFILATGMAAKVVVATIRPPPQA